MARLQEVVVTEWRVSMWLINWLCSHQPWFIGLFPTNFAPHCIIAYLLLCSQWAMCVSQVLDDFTFGFFSAGLLRSEPTYPVLPLTGAKSSLFWQFSSSVQQCSAFTSAGAQAGEWGCPMHCALSIAWYTMCADCWSPSWNILRAMYCPLGIAWHFVSCAVPYALSLAWNALCALLVHCCQRLPHRRAHNKNSKQRLFSFFLNVDFSSAATAIILQSGRIVVVVIKCKLTRQFHTICRSTWICEEDYQLKRIY